MHNGDKQLTEIVASITKLGYYPFIGSLQCARVSETRFNSVKRLRGRSRPYPSEKAPTSVVVQQTTSLPQSRNWSRLAVMDQLVMTGLLPAGSDKRERRRRRRGEEREGKDGRGEERCQRRPGLQPRGRPRVTLLCLNQAE